MSIKATKRLEDLLAARANVAAAHCSKPPPNKPQP
jgi:hypothetical protein